MVNVQNTDLHEEDPIEAPLVEERTKKRRTRGPTRMREIACISSEGQRRVVEYNEVGQAIGVGATKLKSYIGICVRHHIPIIYDNWNIVPFEMKEKIFKLVQGGFVVDLNTKKDIFKIAGKAFRNYKNILTKKYVMPFKDHPECLEFPPNMYSYIEREHWNTFVKSRLSDDFERISKLQKERRGKNKCDHDLMKKSSMYDSTSETPRMEQFGQTVNALTQQAKAYRDESFAKRTHDFDAISPTRDVLSQTLGTSMHSRRVQAVGDLIIPTQYFYKRKRSSRPKVQIQNEDPEKAMLRAYIKELEEQLKQHQFTATSEHVSHSKPVGKEMMDTNTEVDEKEQNIKVKTSIIKDSRSKALSKSMKKGISCKLTVGSVDNIVTVATICDEASTTNMPGVVIECKDVKLSIDVAVNGQCPLPVLRKEGVEGSSQEIDSHFIQPPDPVIIRDADDVKKKSQKTKVVVKACSMTPPERVPLALRFMLIHAEGMKDGRAIIFDIPVDVFGVKRKCYIMQEDLIYLCHMREISVTSISAYMVYLYTVIVKSNALGLYKLMDPATISISAGPQEIRAKQLSARLLVLDPNQLLIVPYNSNGHWLLVIINPSKNIAFCLNSLSCRLQDDIVSVVGMALQTLKAQKGMNTNKKKISWKPVKCPRQPGSVECGYYVMRYMREIISSRSTSIMDLMHDAPSTYTQNELDEVRIEWAEFVGSHI